MSDRQKTVVAVYRHWETCRYSDCQPRRLPFRLDRLEDDGYRAWVAVDTSQTTGEETSADASPATDGATTDATLEASLATTDATLAGFVTTELDESPSVFARPDRLVIGDIYVRQPYRGSGLAERLVDRARTRARECGCGEVTLEVDVDNDRARAFYRKLGFETYRLVQSLPVE